MIDKDWRYEGLCRQVDPELFFPEKGQDTTKAAKRVCAECPVLAQCLEQALIKGERFGVWGGKTERERRKLRAPAKTGRPRKHAFEPSRQRVDRRFPVECGTERGYRRHLADKEPTCGPCRQAHCEYKSGVAA